MAGRWRLLGVHAQLLFTAMVWGGQFVALRIALRELRVLDMLLLRTLLAAGFYAALLGALARRDGRFPRIARADWRALALVALLGVPGAGLGVMAAQRHISADVASLVTVIGPVCTALAAYLLLGQRLSRPQLGGIALALAGFLLLLLLGGKGARFEVRNALGVLLMASSPCCWAFYTVLSKPLVMRYGSARATAYVMLVGAASLAPLCSPRSSRATCWRSAGRAGAARSSAAWWRPRSPTCCGAGGCARCSPPRWRSTSTWCRCSGCSPPRWCWATGRRRGPRWAG
jgi:drug/metabolite transporter (DMT)-like permease